MVKIQDEFQVFRLEKSIPTHCPSCAYPFRSNEGGDFGYDLRSFHPEDTPAEWNEAFPAAAKSRGLGVELVWCGKCQNITLRIITAIRHVTTVAEAVELEQLGYANRRVARCWGVSFSNLPEYTLVIAPDPSLEDGYITFPPTPDQAR